MKIDIKWFGAEKPQFNVELYGSAKEPFLTIRGCRIVEGSKGRFVSWPAQKSPNGKWWNHVMASEAFGAEVLRLATADERVNEEPPF